MKTDAVKLGLMPPLTGLVGLYGTEIVRAGQIACQEINDSGGVLGRPLELVIEDDGSLPESAVTAASKLVDQHRCTAIIGNLLSNSRIAVAYRVAEPRKIPYLNFSFYEGSILSRYFFHFAALPNQQIDRMIPYMRNTYGPRMFFAGNNYEWPRGSIDAAKRTLLLAGGEIVGEEYCPIGVDAATIERLLDQVAAAAPDVFVPYFAGNDQVSLLTRFTQRGLKSRMAVVMGHYDEMMASTLPPEVREGFYSSNSYFMTVDADENRRYLQRLAALPGVNGIWPHGNGILTNFGEGTYVCVKAFAQAANKAGNLDSEALIDVLKTISIAAPQGVVRMDPATHHATVNTYLSRCGADGVFTMVENFGAIDPILPQRYNHQRISHQATLEDDIRLQARMLEQMSEAVLLVRSQTNTIIYSNAGAGRLLGYGKSELINQPIGQLDAPAEMDAFRSSADIARILNQKGEWKGEVRQIKKDGALIWCSVSISMFTHPVFGEVWLWVANDISARKQAEDALQQLNQELEQRIEERTADMKAAKDEAERASLAKSEFLARMSHELRTPMNAILGFAQLLELEPIGAEPLDFAREIHSAGDHLLKLINELLDLSRIESGKLATVVQATHLLPVINDAVQMTRSLLNSKRITLQNQCNSQVSVLADPTRLKQILVNLLSNAAKYNRDEGNIEISCHALGSDRLRISVTDNGQGIPPEKLGQLFQPFERLGAEFSAVDGTGIGLALSKQLAKLMNGTMGVESSPGQGSTFWLELPLTQPVSDLKQALATPQHQILSQHNVLYVEDNAANLRVVEAIFRRHPQLRLLTATNGEHGLELARRYLPQAILLDIHLPGMDGYTVLQELRKDPATRVIPVLALSADATLIDIERGLAAGFRHYVTKPIKVDVLMAALEESLPAATSL